MTDDVNVRKHLIILAAYSLVFVYVVFPYLLEGEVRTSFDLPVLEAVPSIIYWFIARRVLLSGETAPRNIHIIYVLTCVPITMAWVYVAFYILIVPAMFFTGEVL